MDAREKIRVRFNYFTLRHFEISPIWEFATSEEGEEAQDETTLKPRPDLLYPDPSEGLLIIECEFETSSGRKFNGLCSPSFDNSLSSVQPYILTAGQFVMFWFGISQPDKETMDRLYNILGERPESLFPLKFNSKLPMADGSKISGQIDGFTWTKLANRAVLTEK